MTSTALILLVVTLATVSLTAAAVAGLPAFRGNRAARLAVWSGIAGSLIALGFYLVLLWNPMQLVRYGDDKTPDPSGGVTATTLVGTAMAVVMAIAIPIYFRPREQRISRREPAPNRNRWDDPAEDEQSWSLRS
ncbi:MULTISPECIES: hypothetical protein [Nocardiaceae]|uniref:Integral membrane protein n=1 Tax=Rhodococcoides kroppenstedtii TaxID=293050 RepID=A0ABS7NTW3_9NOCA|nr:MULTISPECIES: hypothetical protein [Rhodococcus]AMY20783.1 hypothetical protein A3Q40_03422 [Rhodococcus sp. PBTS 1]MBY6313530.1 hypothetical protein [Rhodococcus kroppenstedtii]MBY6321464.1 hypothetical protein [Rhodococcus kroppenstedtii]MBY6400162.1 hypothetical protein [Rhodococcus kroppenstedtii]